MWFGLLELLIIELFDDIDILYGLVLLEMEGVVNGFLLLVFGI